MSDNPKPNSENEELQPAEQEKVSGGAFDAFLSIDGIKGESQETTHKDWIEVSSFGKGQ
ncbi:MAG TPA: type VI secretion system tube protein Hcp [Bryobacteraceae bacterium]|nr:type VI secretion system tube protein Hcp [Bryobacteraceae bacterium]